MNALKVLTSGGYTTVQDAGRFQFQHMGVPVSGALDAFSFSIANLLVGNPENTAALELTVMGVSLEIRKEMDMALTGAEMGISINDTPVPSWQSHRVRPGDRIVMGQVQSGCRAYLAFGGGIHVPEVMGSCSTYAGGRIGGFHGRPLQTGDILAVRDAPLATKQRTLPPNAVPAYPSRVVVRAVPGPQDHYFDTGLSVLFRSEYMVTPKADRMGYRLQGDAISIKDGMPGSITSEPAMPGSIQIPPDGQPIILLVEQTVGGYAKIATIISSDLPAIAQTTPGDTIQFESVAIATAHQVFQEAQNRFAAIKKSLAVN